MKPKGFLGTIRYILFGDERETREEARAKDTRRHPPKEDYTQLIGGVIYSTKNAQFYCAAPTVLDNRGKERKGRQYLYRSATGRWFFVKESADFPDKNGIVLATPELAAAFLAQYHPSDDPNEVQALIELHFGSKVRLG